eukprot:jgi/Orpsp1_1/1186693/evm.model.d7180000052560.1
MDPPLISDGQTRACNPEKSFEKLLPFPKSPIGCLVYLIKNEKSVDQEMLKWLNQLSLKLSEMRKCDFELLNSFPSNYNFYTFVFSPDKSQKFISDDILTDDETKRKYIKK